MKIFRRFDSSLPQAEDKKRLKEAARTIDPLASHKSFFESFRNLPTQSVITTPVTAGVKNTGSTGPLQSRETPEQSQARFQRKHNLTGKLSFLRRAALRGSFHRQLKKLEPESYPLKEVVDEPDLLAISRDESDVDRHRGMLAHRFQVGDIDGLTQAILDFSQALGLPKDESYRQVVRLASNLYRVSQGHADYALEILNAIRLPENAQPVPPQLDVQVNRLRRSLANTPSGMRLLLTLENKLDLTCVQQEAYRHSLNICNHLSDRGDTPATRADGSPWTGTIEDYVILAQQCAQLGNPIGGENDHPPSCYSKRFFMHKLSCIIPSLSPFHLS
jgi:hypothetical protein